MYKKLTSVGSSNTEDLTAVWT